MAIAICGAVSSPSAASQATAFGTWVNTCGTVRVRTGGCGGKLCGWIVWAAMEAAQDARDSGVDKLIGTELLEDYQQSPSGTWAGQVFVPDLGRKFLSTIVPVNADTLKISGCIFGGLICKSQIWRRV
jgi:uncharacterized protein (DUF2147 family)